MIHLLSTFFSDLNPKYIISGTQLWFLPDPGSCIVYQPHRYFTAYIEYSGQISVIYKRAEVIESLITENLHLPLSMSNDSPLHITPFSIVSKILRSYSVKQTLFIQCGQHSKSGSIFEISPPGLSINFPNLWNLVKHYLYAKLLELGEEDLSTRVMTTDRISKFIT